MADTLIPLTSISVPNLINFIKEDLNDEIIDRIKQHPEWNEIWDGQLLQNSSFAIINFFTYIATKIKEASNRLTKENFFVAADDPQSIINGLLMYGLSTKQNTTAVIDITGIVQNDDFIFEDLIITRGFELQATDLNGAVIPIEIYNIKDGAIDYINDIVIESENIRKTRFNVTGFAGTTFSRRIELPDFDYEKFTIKNFENNIIADQTQIWFDLGGPAQTKLIETDSFRREKSYNSVFTPTNSTGIPMYKLQFDNNGSMQIIFGTQTFGGYFPSAICAGKTLTILYRVGGGKNTNITKGSLQDTRIIETTRRPLTILFTNLSNASGGSDRNDLQEEQFYAPYRFGKDKSLVTKNDIEYELSNVAVHRVVETPRYPELDKKINILHYENYIVPFRNFNDFNFPEVDPTDTAETYNRKFLKQLNIFLNIDKIHDGEVTEEFVTNFIEPIVINNSLVSNFEYFLSLSKPLNGSLSVFATSARDTNKKIDELFFTTNYSGTIHSPQEATNKAMIVSPNPIGVVNLPVANLLRIIFDEPGFVINNQSGGQIMDIVIPPGNYPIDSDNKSTFLAEVINNEILQTNYGGNFPEHKFCYINNDLKIVFSSPITGEFSRVRVERTNGINLFDTLEIPFQTKRPIGTNNTVFLSSTNYNHQESKIDFEFNTNNIQKTELFTNVVPTEWTNSSSIKGPIAEFTILDENNDPVSLIEGENIEIDVYRNISSINNPVNLLATIEFNNIQKISDNQGVVQNNTPLIEVIDDAPNSAILDFDNARFSIRMGDNTGSGTIPIDVDLFDGAEFGNLKLPSIDRLFIGQTINSSFGSRTITEINISSSFIRFDNTNSSNNLNTNFINNQVSSLTSLSVYTEGNNNTFRINPEFIRMPRTYTDGRTSISATGIVPTGTLLGQFDPIARTLRMSANAIATSNNRSANLQFRMFTKRYNTGDTTLKLGRNFDNYRNQIQVFINGDWRLYNKTTTANIFAPDIATDFANSNNPPPAHNRLFECKNSENLASSISDGTNTIILARPSQFFEVGQRIRLTLTSAFLNNYVTPALDPMPNVGDVIVDTTVIALAPSGPSNTTLTLADPVPIFYTREDTVINNPPNPPITVPTPPVQTLAPSEVAVEVFFDIIGDFFSNLNIRDAIQLTPTEYLFNGLRVTGTNVPANASIVNVDRINQTITLNLPMTGSSTTSQLINMNTTMTGDFSGGSDIIDVNQTKYLEAEFSTIDSTNYPPGTKVTMINGDFVSISNNSILPINYQLLDFRMNFRMNGRQGTNRLDIDPMRYVRVGQELSGLNLNPGTIITAIDLTNKIITFNSPADDTVENAEVQVSPHYGFETFNTNIYDQDITFVVRFSSKNYGAIFATYRTNPYVNEGEALGIISLLRNDSKKMICIEPILKKVNFKPIGIVGRVRAAEGFSRFDVANNTRNLIIDRFGYSSQRSFMGIGKGFAIEKMKSLINNENINFGVDLALIDSPPNNISSTEYDYYFVFDNDFISRIKVLEEENPNLEGFSDIYDVKIVGTL